MNACAITVTSSVGEKGLADNHCRDYKLNGVGNTCIATCKGDYGIKGVACVCKCTSMTDVRRDTVLGVMQLSNNVREWHAEEDNQCANSGLVVNGGTEVGHSRLNDQGHFAGYKLDFGTSYPENSCLTEYLYENWEFVGFRRNSSNGGNLKLNEISDGTITVGKERDNQPAQIKGICEAGKSTKYLPAGGGNAVTIHLGNHDGIQLDAKGANAVLEKPSSGTHWDITFLSSDVSPTGNKSSIDLPLQACNQVK